MLWNYLLIQSILLLLVMKGNEHFDSLLPELFGNEDLLMEAEQPKRTEEKNFNVEMFVFVDMEMFRINCVVKKENKLSQISTICPLAKDNAGNRCFEECRSICPDTGCTNNPLLNEVQCEVDKSEDKYKITYFGSNQMLAANGRWTCSYGGIRKSIDLDLTPYITTSTTTSTTTTRKPHSNPRYSSTNFLQPKLYPVKEIEPKAPTNNKNGPLGQNSEANAEENIAFWRIFEEMHVTKPILVVGLLALLLLSIIVNVAFCIRCLLMRRYLYLRSQNNLIQGIMDKRNYVHGLEVQNSLKSHSFLWNMFCCFCQDDESLNNDVSSQIFISDPTYDMNHVRETESRDLTCLEACLCLPRTKRQSSTPTYIYNDRGAFQPTIYGSTNKLQPVHYLQVPISSHQGNLTTNTLFATSTNHLRSNSTNELMYEEMVPTTLTQLGHLDGSNRIRSLMNTPLQPHYNWPMIVNQTTDTNSSRLMSRSYTSQQFHQTKPTNHQMLIKNFEPNPQNIANSMNPNQSNFCRYNSLPRSPTVPTNGDAHNMKSQPLSSLVTSKNAMNHNQQYVYAVSKKADLRLANANDANVSGDSAYKTGSRDNKYHVTMIGGSEDSGVQMNHSRKNNNPHDCYPEDQSPLTTESNNSYNSNEHVKNDHLNTDTLVDLQSSKTHGVEKSVRLEMTKNLMEKADILLREADGLLNE